MVKDFVMHKKTSKKAGVARHRGPRDAWHEMELER